MWKNYSRKPRRLSEWSCTSAHSDNGIYTISLSSIDGDIECSHSAVLLPITSALDCIQASALPQELCGILKAGGMNVVAGVIQPTKMAWVSKLIGTS